MSDKRLRTIKKAAEEIGTSQTFLKDLLRKGKLQRHKVPGGRRTFVSLAEFELLVSPIQHVKSL